jgi:hypothetical protein
VREPLAALARLYEYRPKLSPGVLVRWAGLMASAVLAGGAPAAVRAQQDYFLHVAQSVLRAAATSWTARGFAPIGELRIGTLGESERESVTVALERGWDYVVLGMCDEDCGDLDFHAFGPDGAQIAFDTRPNGRPVVRLTPPADGYYRLEVVMIECSTPPCYYGVQLLRALTTGSRSP